MTAAAAAAAAAAAEEAEHEYEVKDGVSGTRDVELRLVVLKDSGG